MTDIVAGTLGDFLALSAILIGILFGIYFIYEWIRDTIRFKRYKAQFSEGINEAGVEARFIALGGNMKESERIYSMEEVAKLQQEAFISGCYEGSTFDRNKVNDEWILIWAQKEALRRYGERKHGKDGK